MPGILKKWWEGFPNKGGILGAMFGVLFAAHSHKHHEKEMKKAGRTALYAGAGFLTGSLLEKILRKQSDHQHHH